MQKKGGKAIVFKVNTCLKSCTLASPVIKPLEKKKEKRKRKNALLACFQMSQAEWKKKATANANRTAKSVIKSTIRGKHVPPLETAADSQTACAQAGIVNFASDCWLTMPAIKSLLVLFARISDEEKLTTGHAQANFVMS